VVQAIVAVITAAAALSAWYFRRAGRRRKGANDNRSAPQVGLTVDPDNTSEDPEADAQDDVNWLASVTGEPCGLLELIGLDEPFDKAIATRWRRSVTRPLVALLGVDRRGQRVLVDLTRDGPNGLIIGSSGSGTTETLRTVAAYLAMSYPPTRVRLHLVNLKGGAVWHGLRDLPHVVQELTPWMGGDDQPASPLDDLAADLWKLVQEKRSVLGTSTIADHNNSVSDAASQMPFDLVLVDELGGSPSEFGGRLANIEQQGRPLGIGVLVGVQNPMYVPTGLAAMSRFAVVLGWSIEEAVGFVPSAFREALRQSGLKSRRRPGRGVLVRSGHHVTALQVATVGFTVRTSRDAPFLTNERLEELAAAAHRVVRSERRGDG